MRPIPVAPTDPPSPQSAALSNLSELHRDELLQHQRGKSSLLDASAQICASYRQWLASFAAHFVLLMLLWAIKTTIEESNTIEIHGVVSPLAQEVLFETPEVEWDLSQQVDMEPITSELISLAQNHGDLASEFDLSVDVSAMPVDSTLQTPELRIDNVKLLQSGADDLLSVEVGRKSNSVRGAVVNAGGDAGAVDHLTLEIMRRLEDNDLLVAWVMDASASLRPRRAQVIQRFDRIYDELDVLAEDRGDRLLTAIVAFGETTQQVAEPTADREQLQQAVDGIVTDTSGVENVFNAVGVTVRQYGKFQRQGRDLMLVVLTDEMGDDSQLLEAALDLASRNQASVYVIGPIAPFGLQQIKIPWTDEITGASFQLPVRRGPEAAVVETARMIRWDPERLPNPEVLSSGFGPYALTRLAHNTGGVYYLFDDGTLPGPKFHIEDLLDYSPNYSSLIEYGKGLQKQHLRSVLVSTSQTINASLPQPQTKFLAAGIQFEIRDTRKALTKAVVLLDAALAALDQVSKQREQETDSRWQAHHDLLVGRALAHQLRCLAAFPLLDEMYSKPLIPADVTKNAWKLAGDPNTSLATWQGANLAQGPLSDQDSADSPAKLDAEAQWVKQAIRAKVLLQRVVDEHSQTPWAWLAQQELDSPLKFHWRETLVEPPDGEKLPWEKVPWEELTEQQKQIVAKFQQQRLQRAERKKARQEAEHRLPNL